MSENKCSDKEVDVAFNELVRELGGAVDQASYNADAYRNKVSKLDNLVLDSDQGELKCSEAPKKVEPDTILYKLNMILAQLQKSNRRNDEILKHLSTLV
jgi:hypothetical protein